MPFEPIHLVAETMRLLEERNLGWMTEEIRQALKKGRLVPKPPTEGRDGRLKLSKDLMTIAFTDEEQIELMLNLLRQYFVELPSTWQWTQSELSRLVDVPAENVVLTEPGSNEPLRVFSEEYRQLGDLIAAEFEREK